LLEFGMARRLVGADGPDMHSPAGILPFAAAENGSFSPAILIRENAPVQDHFCTKSCRGAHGHHSNVTMNRASRLAKLAAGRNDPVR